MHPVLRTLCGLALAGAAATAGAYNQGGHYDTIVSLLDEELRDEELDLQAFCAEIPDLSREFDATTQRVQLFLSPRDLLWGAAGYCQTPRSAHMVTSQYYLHGLSGAPTDQIRTAAARMIRDLQTRLDKTTAREDRLYLVCMRGMALHLFGDSFAHSHLSRETPRLWPGAPIERRMYPTGLGHVRDGLNPDYLYGHTNAANMWPRMVLDVATLLPAQKRLVTVLATHEACDNPSTWECEEHGIKALRTDSAGPAIDKMKALFDNDNTGIAKTERGKLCQEFFNDKHAAPARLDCETLWRRYLELAVPLFRQMEIDPTDGPGATAHASCTAWRCARAGQSRRDCPVVITDEVSHGR